MDVIAEQADRLLPLEIKSGKSITLESTKVLNKYVLLAGESAVSPTLIYGGGDSYNKQGIQVKSWLESGNVLLAN